MFPCPRGQKIIGLFFLDLARKQSAQAYIILHKYSQARLFVARSSNKERTFCVPPTHHHHPHTQTSVLKKRRGPCPRNVSDMSPRYTTSMWLRSASEMSSRTTRELQICELKNLPRARPEIAPEVIPTSARELLDKQPPKSPRDGSHKWSRTPRELKGPRSVGTIFLRGSSRSLEVVPTSARELPENYPTEKWLPQVLENYPRTTPQKMVPTSARELPENYPAKKWFPQVPENYPRTTRELPHRKKVPASARELPTGVLE